MTKPTPLSGPRHSPAGGGPARQLVVLLHGLGADGNDLIGLAPHWAARLPDAAFVAPNAPEPCDMAPAGFQWFSLQTLSPPEVDAGVARAAPLLDAFIDEELASLGLNEDRLALVGFSQGTMMALHVALRRAWPCAGIVGFSGRLANAAKLEAEVRAKPPILLVHGRVDDLIPITSMFEAVSNLGAAGLKLEWHVSEGVGHGIAEDGLRLAGDFLARVLR